MTQSASVPEGSSDTSAEPATAPHQWGHGFQPGGAPGSASKKGKVKKPRGGKLRVNWPVARFWWALAMLVGFFLSFIATVPSGAAGDWSKDLSAAEMKYSFQANEANGAPQQAVLNGWHTNDLLGIQAKIAGDQRDQSHRLTALVFFLGLGLLGDLVLRNAEAFRESKGS